MKERTSTTRASVAIEMADDAMRQGSRDALLSKLGQAAVWAVCAVAAGLGEIAEALEKRKE